MPVLSKKESLKESNKKRLQDVILGGASTIVKARQYVDDSLGIDCLAQFINHYMKKDPNVLYFSPKEKLDKRRLALLLFLQCLDDGNPDRSSIIKELNKTLKQIDKEAQDAKVRSTDK